MGAKHVPSQIKVWEINGEKIVPGNNVTFSDSHKEDELEGWIVQNPDLLGERLLIVARQLIVPDVGRLDLLGIDANGQLVIIELKRSLLPREAVAQGLDYASWLNAATEEEILAKANQYLQEQSKDPDRTLADAFEETFGKKLPDWVCQNHRVLLLAAGLDASAERIVNYLAQKQIGINAIFFNYAELSDKKQVLVRSVLVPESVNPPKIGGEPVVTESAVLAIAKNTKTLELVNICRGMRDVWEEQVTSTAKGSCRYWAGGRMIYGINVSGQLADAPEGQLDIWVRTEKLAEVSGVPEKTIKQRLSTHFSPFAAGRMDFVIRIKNVKEAETLVAQLREFATQQNKTSSVAAK
jgi:hypothetical protein